MKLRQWIGKKIMGKPPSNGSLTDIDRDNALNQRRLNAAMKQQEKMLEMLERVSAMEAKVNPRTSPMDELVAQALPILLQKIAQETPSGKSVSPSQEIRYTPEQIKDLLKQNPQLKKQASKVTDEGIRDWLVQQEPNLSKDTIEQIILEVRA